MKYLIFITLLFINGCNNFSPGTLGSFQKWRFPISEKQFDAEVNAFFKSNLQYGIPQKWKHLDSWNKNGYSSLNGKIFYFNEKPEEMYYVSYSPDVDGFEDEKKSKSTTISVRAINAGNDGGWNTVEDLEKNKNEINRVNERFYKQIIVKLEKQTNVKSEKYDHWYD